jgi:hypothetical protein
MTLTVGIVYHLQFLIYIVSKTRPMIERSFFYGVELNIRFYLSVKFTSWQKISRWPLSKMIVLIKPRTSEEQQPNRRKFHDQDVAVNVLSKVDGDCCKPPIQSGKAPPYFTSSTEYSGAMLSVRGQILRPVFVIPSYSDFQILVETHRILAVCVCVCGK